MTLARTLTDTFAGISPVNGPMFMVAQVVGALAAMARWAGCSDPNRISMDIEITLDTRIQRAILFP